LIGISISEHHEAIDESLKGSEALGGSEAEHPKDDVVVVPFPDVWLQGLGLGVRDRFLCETSGVGWVAHGSIVAEFSLPGISATVGV